MKPTTTVFTARKIITMNPSNPEATAVAVRNGRTLAVGSLEELRGWGPNELDETFRDKVITPGFIELHAQRRQAALWSFPYVGYIECEAPDGSICRGVQSVRAIVARLREAESHLGAPPSPVIAWGYDPTYFSEDILTSETLDQVSLSRPIFVLHTSGKAATVNSALLKMIDDRKLDHRQANKANNGEIRGIGAIAVADDVFDQVLGPMSSCESFLKFSSAARRCGITTVGDSSGVVSTVELLTAWKKVICEHGGIRVLIYNAPLLPLINETGPIIEEVLAARRASEPLVRMGAVYVPVDGEIQDFNAVLRWPGYFNGAANGKLRVDPEIFGQVLLDLHRRGISVHSHCEGDGAVDVFVNAVSDALRQYPWLEHRHSIDHSHLVTTDQCRAMAKLGIGANIFVGDLWRWGDQHLLISVGPERARRITACATARREGVHFSIHSDPFVTSHGPLHAMWCAVNRITPDGRVLGKEEAISPYEAMYACTVDAAYQLGMDNEIGTIEAGKWADFAVIEADPFTIDPTELRHITVWGTVVAGQVFPRKSTA